MFYILSKQDNIITGYSSFEFDSDTEYTVPAEQINKDTSEINPETIGYKYEQNTLSETRVGLPLEFDYTQLNRYNARLSKLCAITVTVNGKIFQGNEQSQNRLANKISIMNALGETSTQWKLLDNSWVEVTIEELTEALKLASKAMEDILKEY